MPCFIVFKSLTPCNAPVSLYVTLTIQALYPEYSKLKALKSLHTIRVGAERPELSSGAPPSTIPADGQAVCTPSCS